MRNLSVLVKPSSHNCNIDCKYCFNKDEVKLRKTNYGQMMSTETLEALVKRAFEFADGFVTFVFQGGEPTLMGLEFFKTFIDYVEKYNTRKVRCSYSIQTNGILLDKDWYHFLKKFNFLVGLSFDGMPDIHDLNRIDYEGNGTSDYAVRAIRHMQTMGMAYNVLMVVTHDSAKRAKECYKYLKDLGVEYIQVIPVIDPYGEAKCSRNWSLTREDLRDFLITLFDLWYVDFQCRRAVTVTYFENIIYALMGNTHCFCGMNGQCMLEMVIEADGSVYPCDFYMADEWVMGNIQENSFLNLIRSETAARFISKSVELGNRCQKCEWLGCCQGSCRRYQLAGKGRYDNYYCDAYKAFFSHAGWRMKRIAQDLLQMETHHTYR